MICDPRRQVPGKGEERTIEPEERPKISDEKEQARRKSEASKWNRSQVEDLGGDLSEDDDEQRKSKQA